MKKICGKSLECNFYMDTTLLVVGICVAFFAIIATFS